MSSFHNWEERIDFEEPVGSQEDARALSATQRVRIMGSSHPDELLEKPCPRRSLLFPFKHSNGKNILESNQAGGGVFVMGSGAPQLERITREVSCEIMRGRWWEEGVVWDEGAGVRPYEDEHAGEERGPEQGVSNVSTLRGEGERTHMYIKTFAVSPETSYRIVPKYFVDKISRVQRRRSVERGTC